jgi:hypothetical protein
VGWSITDVVSLVGFKRSWFMAGRHPMTLARADMGARQTVGCYMSRLSSLLESATAVDNAWLQIAEH